MPRVLGNTINKMEITDPRTNESVTFSYQSPSNKMMAAYNAATSSSFRVRGGRVDVKGSLRETRLEYGLKLITGFEDTDFVVPKEGKLAPVSSREGTEHYYPAWRELLREHAADLVIAFATAVFEGALAAAPEGEEEEAEKNGQSASFLSGISLRSE